MMKILKLEDNELWTKFRKGDNEAFSRIYSENSPKLYRYGLKITSNHWAYIFGVKRKEAHMSQVKKEILKKNEKFEDGVLRADACMERYQSSRDSQYRTHSEDLPEQAFGLSALWEERNLMKNVYKLMAKGFKPNGSESLETFVEKHQDLLDEGGDF